MCRMGQVCGVGVAASDLSHSDSRAFYEVWKVSSGTDRAGPRVPA